MNWQETSRPKIIDLTGQKFGRLTVVKKSERKDLNRTGYWDCVCDCGNPKTVRSDGLCKGITKSCGCYKRDRQAELWDKKVPRNLAAKNRVREQYRMNAINRGFTWELTDSDFDTLTDQDCSYCGIPPSTTKTTPRGSFTYNGLDRIDNNSGYTLNNVVTCCAICNRMKGFMPYEDFITKLDRITNYRKAL